MSLQPTELVFVAPTNQAIEADGYKDTVINAKEVAKEGFISIFVEKQKKSDSRYVTQLGGDLVRSYVEKPQQELRDVYKNVGFLLFENGVLLHELGQKFIEECKTQHANREIEKGRLRIAKCHI